MYKVICITQGKEYDLLNFADESLIIYDAKLTQEINKAGSLEFTILPGHPNYSVLFPIVTTVKIYQDDDLIYTGRVTDKTKDFYNCRTVYCEGILAYLCDSLMRPNKFIGATATYVRNLIENHNSRVEQKKQFQIGQLLSEESQIEIDSSDFSTTMDEFQNNLVAGKGLYIEAEERDGTNYINCTGAIIKVNSQSISFGDNLLDFDEKISGTSIKTVIIGIGGNDAEGNPVYVEVEDSEAVETFGRIEGKKEFPDVTDSEELTALTEEYLQQVITLSRSIEVMAVDLSMLLPEIEKLRLGYVNIESEPHEIKERMILSKITKDLTDPSKDIFTLGWEGKFYTERMMEEIRKKSKGTGYSSNIKSLTYDETLSILKGEVVE